MINIHIFIHNIRQFSHNIPQIFSSEIVDKSIINIINRAHSIIQQGMQLNLQNFTLLHNHLMTILTTNNFQSEHLPEKIMQYIGMIVESQKNPLLNQDLFDFFCENSGNKIIKLTLQVDPMLSVKILAMLFINLTSQHWISYLLCQTFIVDAIQYDDIPADEQWPEYYISLLKSLSIRLNEEQLSLFFNKKFCKFPLMYQALKYYNHPDCMVRTNVMNIILGIMKIKDPRLVKYFGRFPFTSYVLTYCCQVKARIEALNTHLNKITQNPTLLTDKTEHSKHKSHIKSYYIDIIDYICYLNDLIQLGSPQLAYFVMNCLLVYILLPTLGYLQEKGSPLLACSTVFLIFTLFKTVTNQRFKQILSVIVMVKQLPESIINRILHSEQSIYMPKIYSETFEPNKYYWNKFEYQIEKQCMKLFGDIKDFETDHESKLEVEEHAVQFKEQIRRISKCVGFEILTYGAIGDQIPFMELLGVLGLEPNSQSIQVSVKLNVEKQSVKLAPNPLRESLLKLLTNSIQNYTEDSLILSITTLLNHISKCETTSNKTLSYCGLLFPKLDTINYKQQFNIESLNKLKQIGFTFMRKVNQNVHLGQEDEKRDEGLFSFQTMRNFYILLFDVFYEKLSQQEEKILLAFYKNSMQELKQLIVKKNMKIIVQNFEYLYSKWTRQAFYYTHNLNHSVLTPRKSVKDLTSEAENSEDEMSMHKLFFESNKQRVLYFILKFVLSEAFYQKYCDQFLVKDKENKNKNNLHIGYTTIYTEKYRKIEQTLKIGHSYKLGFKHMVECYSQQKKQKNTKKYIIVEDPHNLIIVEPSSQQNSAKILTNHPWKYVVAEIDRETGRKMVIKLKYSFKGENRVEIFFENQPRNLGTLQWMNGLKYERYMSEQAFILNYIKQSLSKL